MIRVLFYVVIMGVLGVVIYSNTLQIPFIFDDFPSIKNNTEIRLTHLNFNEIKRALSSGRSRPIARLSFALNYYFHHYSVAGFRVVNILIHVFTSILIFFLFHYTLLLGHNVKQNQRENEVRRPFISPQLTAFIAAMIWMFNPLHTQSVTYIVQRMNSMSSMFCVLSLLLYIKGRFALNHYKGQSGGIKFYNVPPKETVQREKRSACWSNITLFSCAAMSWLLGLGCKETAAIMPVVVLLYEWYFFQNLSRNFLKRKLKPLTFLILLVGCLAFLLIGPDPIERFKSIKDFANNEFTYLERVLTQPRVICYYLSLLFYPHPSRLNFDYDFPLSHSLTGPWTTSVSILTILGFLCLAIGTAKRNRLLSFCILWYFLTLTIESSVIPLAIIFEHRTYLPSVFISLLAVTTIVRFYKPFAFGILCYTTIISGLWTYERNNVWKSELTLWQDTATKSPFKARPHNNLGLAYYRRNLNEAAIVCFNKALDLKPEFFEAHNNLGLALAKIEKTPEAIRHFKLALHYNHKFADAHSNLGMMFEKKNRKNDAEAHYRAALLLKPDVAETHFNLANLLSSTGDISGATKHYQEALRINPNYAHAYNNMALSSEKQNQIDNAVIYYRNALRIDPNFTEAIQNFGALLINQGKFLEALTHFENALEMKPDFAEGHNSIAALYLQQGEFDDAIEHLKKALLINSGYKTARANLNLAISKKRDFKLYHNRIAKQIAQEPENVILHYQMGKLYEEFGKLSESLKYLKKAERISPVFIPALNKLALIYAKRNEYDLAISYFKKIIDAEPSAAPKTYYNISCLYAKQNKIEHSITWMKKAINNGYRNWENLRTDQDLKNVRTTNEFQMLIQKQKPLDSEPIQQRS